MPSLQARILAAFIINVSLFILSVSAQHHHSHPRHQNPNHFRKLIKALPVISTQLNSDISANISQPTLPNKGFITPQQQKRPSSPSREFLIAHNTVRTGLGEPPLKWDKNLARYARRWASKRVFDCKMIHSFGPYGENIFWGGRDHWTPTDVVRSWVNENKYYHRDSNDCEQGQMCGHYTQIVWRDTLRLGCARVKCNSGGVFIVCTYDPPGNYVNESPFDTANNASATPSPTTPTTPPPPSSQTPPQSGPLSPPATTPS